MERHVIAAIMMMIAAAYLIAFLCKWLMVLLEPAAEKLKM